MRSESGLNVLKGELIRDTVEGHCTEYFTFLLIQKWDIGYVWILPAIFLKASILKM